MAKKLQKLNTAVKAIFKDGVIRIYNTIEEAARDLNLSVAAIKIRCNKSNCKSKIRFEWIDDYTKRYYRAKKSKNKGSDFEYQIIDKLKSIGYKNVCRSAGESRNLDASKIDIADPSNELEVAIQAKNLINQPNYYNIRKDCNDLREFVVLWHKSDDIDKKLALISYDFFFKLLELYHKSK